MDRESENGDADLSGRRRRGIRGRGERTRLEILEAIIRVIAERGVRGVSHREVAREAGVSLSLTTYYFADLRDLVASAFRHLLAGHLADYGPTFEQAFRELDRLLGGGPPRAADRARVRDFLVRRIVGYVREKLETRPIGLAAEHHLLFERLLDPAVREIAEIHRSGLVAPFVELCRRLGTREPTIDADLLLGTILRLEYEQLVDAGEGPDLRRLRRVVGRLVDLLLEDPGR